MVRSDERIKSLCGSVNLLAKLFGKDADRLKQLYGLPLNHHNLCQECGKLIPKKNKFCSSECRKRYKCIPIACSYCGQLLERRAAEVIWRLNHNVSSTGKPQDSFFCSAKCKGKWLSDNYGFKVFPEHIRNKRKWDYELIEKLGKSGYTVGEISRKLQIPYITVYSIIGKLRKGRQVGKAEA